MAYTDFYSTRITPQSQPIPSQEMVKNSAGGYVFKVSDKERLMRFLILGAESGTYYVGKSELVVENAKHIVKFAEDHGREVVDTIVEVSQAGRAPKNDPALFALALCASSKNQYTRAYALAHLSKVARTASHLMQFVSYVTHFRGWGRGLRTAVAAWYLDKSPEDIAYQTAKYRQRFGWTHADLLRVSHPTPKNEKYNNVFKWILSGRWEDISVPEIIEVFENLQVATEREAVGILREYKAACWEMLPTELLNSPSIWNELLVGMPMTAMIRNLPKMTSLGILAPLSDNSKYVIETLTNKNVLAKARVHPIRLLVANLFYQQGTNRNMNWVPNQGIVRALEEAFYLAFQYAEPAGKNMILGVDVSGSMGGGNVAGIAGFTPALAAAAQALVLASTEPNTYIFGFSDRFVELPIRKGMDLRQALEITNRRNFGRTDCAMPMLHALEQNMRNIDAFVVLTDNETWAGQIHPVQALDMYNRKMQRNAKMVTVAMTPTMYSIGGSGSFWAGGGSKNTLEVAGFDAAVPELITTFLK